MLGRTERSRDSFEADQRGARPYFIMMLAGCGNGCRGCKAKGRRATWHEPLTPLQSLRKGKGKGKGKGFGFMFSGWDWNMMPLRSTCEDAEPRTSASSLAVLHLDPNACMKLMMLMCQVGRSLWAKFATRACHGGCERRDCRMEGRGTSFCGQSVCQSIDQKPKSPACLQSVLLIVPVR